MIQGILYLYEEVKYMKALVKYSKGAGNMEIREVPEPKPGPGEVKIEVKAAGICGSDIHIYHDSIAIPLNPPVVTGHEFSGEVNAIGEGVTSCKVGDRVTSETAINYCGQCYNCKTGFYNLCNERKTLGYWYNGAFAKFTIVPQDKIHLLPKKISFVEGALLEPLACVTHATMDQNIISPTDIVLITGPGAIGLMALQVAKACGAKVLISGNDYDIKRLEFARKIGADRIINIQHEDIYQIIQKETCDRGVDVVFECSGSSSAIKTNMDLIKKRGKYNQIGLTEKMTSLDFNQICYKELKVTGSLGSIWKSWKNAILLVKNDKVNLKFLITHQFPLTSWKEGFDIFENKKGIKIILKPV